MTYFTSDLHLGHERTLETRRMFTSVDEMDAALIANWNDRVTAGDLVMIVGDLMFRSKKSPEAYLSALNGKKVLIRGNHDAAWIDALGEYRMAYYFEGVYDMHLLDAGSVKLFLCHYPMIEWEHSRQGSLLICGHLHGKKAEPPAQLFAKVPYAFNAGVDVNGMKPVTLAEMIQNNDRFYGSPLDKKQREECLRRVRALP